MLTRVFLAAGVAALAIAAPAASKPGGGGGEGKGGQAAQSVQRGGGGGGKAVRVESRGGGGGQAFRAQSRGGGFSAQRAPRIERAQRAQMPRFERAQRFAAFQERGNKADRRIERSAKPNRVERAQVRANRVERAQNRIDRQQLRAQRVENRVDRQQLRAQRVENRLDRRELRAQRVENRLDRRELRADRQVLADRGIRVRDLNGDFRARGWGVGECPPGLISKGCVPPGHGINAAARIANADAFRTSNLAALALGTRLIDPVQAVGFVGSPLSTVNNVIPLMALPGTFSYLYPDTSDYYYRYGGGYLYEVDRDTNLIAALLPLLAGGFLPGQYLPSTYMSSYVPSYYGFNSFYPDSPYDCNRYANGVIYEVDCVTGLVEDVIPLYAGGYGVGQLLPSSYGYYNVPMQYRTLYYDTPDYNYWYAPGAIYQYDPGTSLITSVAALLSPGLTIGQPLPMGYNVYNVPLGYRDVYYDTPSALYRYNNGYIYQVDPTTMLVTAIVASILT